MRFDEGHSFIKSPVREVLLRGRLWRVGKNRSYFIRACDAFTGEVVGSRIFSGKLTDVAAQVSKWVKKFRLSDDIKNDFYYSSFHHSRRNIYPWKVDEELIQNYGLHLERPANLRVSRRRSRQVYRAKESMNRFINLVEQQWKDGFRDKAIRMLKDEWKKSRNPKLFALLKKYFFEAKKYQDAIIYLKPFWRDEQDASIGCLMADFYNKNNQFESALKMYDHVVMLKDCPASVYANYNKIRHKLRKAGKVIVTARKTVPKDRNFPEINPTANMSEFEKGVFSLNYARYYIRYGEEKSPRHTENLLET